MTTRRIPAARRLAAQILATSTGKAQTLAASETFLLGKRADLAAFSGVEEFATAPESAEIAQHRGCEHHLVRLRAQLARELWSRRIFIGVSVLDDLLFNAVAHDTTATPVRRVLEIIRDECLHMPGIVIFPVHSFGLLGAGFLHWATDARVEYISPPFGLALSPQTNGLAATVAFLERARTALGVKKPVSPSLIRHWYHSRSARWLTSNPLLVVRVQSFPGGYYENQSHLLRTLRASTALISMLSCLQPRLKPGDYPWSSATVNNFQTLDARHYIVLFNSPQKRTLGGDCVPMHLQTPSLAEVSDLNVTLDPRFWRRQNALATRIHDAINTVHEGHVRYSFGADKDTPSGRYFRKMFESLAFFRRSFRDSENDWHAVVSLAIAFEMLLTDSYAKQVYERLMRRVRLLLRGVPGVRKFVAEMGNLYNARGAVVHKGATELAVDMRVARKGFILVFVELAERASKTPPVSSEPAKELIGDVVH